MKKSSRFWQKWPELLALVSLTLIALFVWQKFFKVRYPSVHLSCFAFRDVNRNGIYDVGDRPYAGLKVKLQSPTERSWEEESNMAGFANFDLSLGSRKAPISQPGEFTVSIISPPGWEVTSGNPKQVLSIQKVEKSAVGLVAARTIDPVGIAPRLTISGVIPEATNAGTITVEGRGAAGERLSVPVSKEGAFTLPVTAGLWTLKYAEANLDANAASSERVVSVQNYPVIMSRWRNDHRVDGRKTILKVIGFDNLTTSDTLLEIPNGYEGLEWRNWVATHQKFYGQVAPVNATTSAEYLAYTSSGHPATISSHKAFDFVGVNLTLAWAGGEPHDVVVRAWRGDAETYHDAFRAKSSGPNYFDADYRNITRLEFASEGYWQVMIDDLAIRTD